jgi:hypothetical protein
MNLHGTTALVELKPPIPSAADIAAWEIFGPAIFHGDMTGPEALASHALAARIEALKGAAKWFDALPANARAFTNSEIATAIRTLNPTTIVGGEQS